MCHFLMVTKPVTNQSEPLQNVQKNDLLRDLLARVRVDLEALVRSQEDTHNAATHEENRSEHPKDTRATEQSYLARGLAERVEALRRSELQLSDLELRAFTDFDPIQLTALVRIQDDRDRGIRTWWLIPTAGGLEIQSGDEIVRTITPASPIGRSLIGLRVGDEGSFETPRGTRNFEVLAVR